MSLEPIRERHVATNQSETTDQYEPSRPDTGSVWWAELSLGTVACLAAVGVALATTSFGPLSSLAVSFGMVPTMAYLVVATVVGLTLLTSGLERSPYADRLD